MDIGKKNKEALDNLTSRDVYLRLSEETKNIRKITKIKVYKE